MEFTIEIAEEDLNALNAAAPAMGHVGAKELIEKMLKAWVYMVSMGKALPEDPSHDQVANVFRRGMEIIDPRIASTQDGDFQDSTGQQIRPGDWVRFRGEIYKIFGFRPDQDGIAPAWIVFHETDPLPDQPTEINVDLVPRDDWPSEDDQRG